MNSNIIKFGGDYDLPNIDTLFLENYDTSLLEITDPNEAKIVPKLLKGHGM